MTKGGDGGLCDRATIVIAHRKQQALKESKKDEKTRPARLERATYRFVVWYSIQLSYGRL